MFDTTEGSPRGATRRGLLAGLGLGIALLGGPTPAEAVTYVKSVEYVEIAIGNAATTASANLTKGQITANCVPFASMMTSGVDGQFDQFFSDVFFQAGPTRVTVQRSTAGGALSVGVFVVEFDPAFVNVQQGTFALPAASATTTAAITAVTLTKAALVSYYRHGAVTNNWTDYAIAGRFSLTTQLSWQRNTSAGAVSGHYYVFEARNTEFSVQAVSFAIGNNATSANQAITAVDMDKTMVIASYRTALVSSANENGQIGVFLANPTTLTAQRTFEVNPSSTIDDVRAFVVQFDDNVRVQRGVLNYADADTQQNAAIRLVDLASTMVWNGSSIGPGTTENEATALSNGDTAFQRLKLTSATNVRGDRDGTCAATDCQGIGHFEVVEFNPSGQMLVKSGLYTGNGIDNRAVFVGFQPDVVFVKRDNTTYEVVRTSTMAGDATKSLNIAGAAFFPNGIQSLDPQGFTVGTDLTVNGAGDDYYWVAFKAAPGEMKVGTYTGNNTDNRSITGVGFQPEYVITLPVVAGAAGVPFQRSASMVGDTTYNFDATEVGPPANAIQALEGDGFQIGTQASINTNLAIYHYIAWNAVPGRMAVGTYVGNGLDNRNLDIVGFMPEWVLIKRTGDQRPWIHKPASTGINTNYSLATSNFAGQADDIQTLRPLGFQVGFGPEAAPDRANEAGVTYHWIAFGPHQPQVNYRSIGTAPAYGTGTITVTQSLADVTGVGTAWRTNNRGRGDVLTVPCPNPPTCTGGVNYPIYSVGSNTSLRLATPYTGATSAGLTYLIRRQFQTLNAWEDCVDGNPCAFFPVGSSDLVADDRSEVGIAYKDSVFTELLLIDGSTTDASHTITLTADPGNRHLGIPGNGVVVDMGAGAGNNDGIQLSDNFVTVEWLEIRNSPPPNDAIEVANVTAPNYRVVRYNLIHNAGLQGVQIHGADVDALIYDNIIYNMDVGIHVDDTLNPTSTVRILNNTIFNTNPGAMAGIGSVAPVSGTPVLVRNNISHTSAGGNDYGVLGLDPASSHNLASDVTGTTTSPAGGGINSVSLAAMGFVNTTAGSENLHITAGSAAVNVGTDLSTYLNTDIDTAPRFVPWDIGADDLFATTEVDLLSFTARGALGPAGTGAVDLEWETASELHNLGFHLYRSTSEGGPFERITASLIPGLGNSPTGQSYAWLDTVVTPETRYFYLLEDVETTGRTERHGPVSAIPNGAGGSGGDGTSGGGSPGGSLSPAGTQYGDVGTASLQEVEHGTDYVVLELVTPGFTAVPQGDGTVRLDVAGFDHAEQPGAPAVPTKGAVVAALAGRRVRVASVVPSEVLSVPGLRVSTAGARTVVVTADGMVKPGTSRRTLEPAFARGGYYPRLWAQVQGVAFQGETKKARLELSPLRHDARTGSTLLARRLLVRVEFVGIEPGEKSLGGSRGRRLVEIPLSRRGVVAQLVTRAEGLYRVAFEDLFGTTRGGLPVSSLRLSRRGVPVAYHVEPDRALFAPGSSLYFVGGGDENPNGDMVYEVDLGKAGLLMPVVLWTPTGPDTTEYEVVRSYEENKYYQAGILEAPDLWLWDLLVSPVSKSYAFTTEDLASSSRPGRIKVWLQGASDFEADPDHHVRVSLNGQLVGEASWDGKKEQTIEAEILPGILQEGANTLSLENAGDTGAAYSMVFLNRYEVSYPRRLVAQGGRLEGTWRESGVAEVSGLGVPGAVVDTTDGATWVRGIQPGGSGLRFRAESDHRYLATDTGAMLLPEIRRSVSSRLHSTAQRADWLLVAPRAFLAAAEPLVALRQSQGLATQTASIEEVNEEFGQGEAGPQGLKAFLQYAYQNWRKPSLRYVVLLGDSTYDPKDFLKTHVADQIPFLPLKTSYLWTASDPSYAAVNGDDLLPDVALGRLPAASVEEARVLVEKLVTFETAGRTLEGRAVLVADNADLAGPFEAHADEVASTVLRDREVQKIYLRDLGEGTRPEIVAAFDSGPALVSYIGHGATAVWASENVFNNTDVPSLSAQDQQPLLMTLNCLNGYFHFPPFDSLAEALLKAEGKGAIAAFSPSGLSLDEAAHVYHKALLTEISSKRHARLGDAVLAAQSAYADSGAFPELLAIYHLFGDPAQKIR